MRPVFPLSFALGLLIASMWPIEAALPSRSISVSRQFIVYGDDAGVRGAVCDLAERTKKNALSVLQQSDGWETPVVVHARISSGDLPGTPPAQLSVSQTGFGLKLQLELAISANVSALAVERELLRAILLERAYRGEADTPAGTPYVGPPEWFLEGLLASAPETDPAPLADALLTHVAGQKITPLGDFLRQKPELLESPSRIVYRAYSFALLSTLRQMTNASSKLSRFLAHLPKASTDPMVDLLAHFPELGSDAAKAEKIWAQGVSRVAAREGYRAAPFAETERQLSELRIEIAEPGRAPKGYTLEEFPQFVRHPAAQPALHRCSQQLLLLAARAHPIYQPVVAEYQRAIALLLRGKSRRLPQQLATLRATREQLQRRMSAIDDYLNWFEATQSQTASGAFREYLRAAEVALEREPRRRDPISVYLDALESQF